MSIKLYSIDKCIYCNKIKKYLIEKGISFNEYNVENNIEKFEEMFEKSIQQEVPVLDFDGKIIVGFDKQKLDKLIYN